ncbi:MAG: hypothetical protein JXB42_13330 [Deltaproteobacteria bacterium]|nr:hypothetical protein [Deltaproteobacteria bacterium]
MKVKYFIILLLSVSYFPLSFAWGEADAPNNKPVQITSNRLDVYDSKKLAIFSGNVQVKQQDTVITSDELHVFYKGESDNKKEFGDAEAMNAGNIDRIEAKGNVTIVQGDRIITGDDAVFFNKEEKVIVTGHTVMQEGKNVIKGGKITFLMREKRSTVERAERERVTATIYSEGEKN